MKFEYIIVQCGGLGTRLEHHTRNKPKALVAARNLPIIFHLFQLYPKKKFIIISDYKSDILNDYLETFAKIEYIPVETREPGNVSGIKHALEFIPNDEAFMLLWSDLILDFSTDDLPTRNYVGVTKKFRCSWKFENHVLEKVSTDSHGVAGCFLFENKSLLKNIPTVGSFTKFLKNFEQELFEMDMQDSIEIGSIESLEKYDPMDNRCRPYNKITFIGDRVIKEGLTAEAEILLDRERDWYEKISAYDFHGIPKIFSMRPLTMQRIHGTNIFRADIAEDRKPAVLKKFVETLRGIHELERFPANPFDMQKDYYQKTIDRLEKIQSAIPFATRSEFYINSRLCKNPLLHKDLFRKVVDKIMRQPSQFGIIHGDCTFTNSLIDSDENIFFIDARGYFGNTKLIGDVYYDWAKIYYSIVGRFDKFNVKKFQLTIGEKISYEIEKSGWEHLEEYFFELLPNLDRKKIRFVHAIIWLSLASHCWDDFDSMCLAFYNGTFLWNEAVKEYESC